MTAALTISQLTITLFLCAAFLALDPVTSPVYEPRPVTPVNDTITVLTYGDSILLHLERHGNK